MRQKNKLEMLRDLKDSQDKAIMLAVTTKDDRNRMLWSHIYMTATMLIRKLEKEGNDDNTN